MSIYCLVNLPEWAGMKELHQSVSKIISSEEYDKKLEQLPPISDYRKLIYVRSAFRVRDDEIRISIVKSNNNKLPLFFSYGSKSGLVEQKCHLKKCPDSFSSLCDVNGYIGFIKNLSKFDDGVFLSLTSTNNLTMDITVKDVRPSKKDFYEHRLGVCLQPVYLMTNSLLFIQFFEYWLSEGASKFYIYWESLSPEVQEIINFYKKNSKIDIEMINWSRLPVHPENGQDEFLNPNFFWFRLEVFLGIFDCMQRARFNVKYVAQSDLDEIFHVENKSLINFLEEMNEKNPEMSDIQFLSRKVQIKSLKHEDISNIADFFKSFENVSVDLKPFQKPLYTKIIYRPERSLHVHIHRPGLPEFIPGKKGERFKHVDANPSEATVWHLRRLNDYYKDSRKYFSTDLKAKVKFIHYQFGFLTVRSQLLQLNRSISLKNESFRTRVPSKEFRNYSYIHSAFRVSDDTIRVTLIREHKRKTPLFYKYGNKSGTVNFECALPSCLDFYSKPCSLIGQIGVIKENFQESVNTIEFSTKMYPQSARITNSTEFSKNEILEQASIDIKDVRIKNNHVYPHLLGVCVQPIYLHADYVLFVQFFEFWLSQGATKFYIYRESYTPEIHQILELYNITSEAEIELVDWSLLPASPGAEGKSNPNAYIYRLELMLSIFDCLHRARGNVKFVAQTDLDELIYIKDGRSVLSFMESFSESEPLFASLSFQSQRIFFDEHAVEDIKSPLDINFTKFEQVKLENFTFARPFYSKLIYRPERIFRAHSHQQFTPEKIPKSVRRFQNKLISPDNGVVLHMRRSADTFQWKQTTKSDILKPLAKIWTESFQNRISEFSEQDFKKGIPGSSGNDLNGETSEDGPKENSWKNMGVQVVREVDECRRKMQKNKDKECHNVFVCEESFSKKFPDAFIHSKNSWIFV